MDHVLEAAIQRSISQIPHATDRVFLVFEPTFITEIQFSEVTREQTIQLNFYAWAK
jgi:hypothetical protein